MPYTRVKKAIEDIKQGKMVVMVDDEDRENEGDLVYASTFSTPEKVNFMITNAKGLVCISITKECANRLNLTPMVANNDSSHETAFTVSVDAKNAKTGISAHERDMAIKIINDPLSLPKDLVRPGHIFPLIAKKGGVLSRTGHTEGSIDLCKFAGLAESAVICEIVKDNGEMARRDDLEKFCKQFNISMISIEEIVKYRLEHESLIEKLDSYNTEFLGDNVQRVDFTDHFENRYIVYIFGSISSECAVKFHNILTDIELLSSIEKYNSLMNAIKYLKKEGGVLIFLPHIQKVSNHIKEYGVGAQILRYFKISKIRLLSSKRGKEFVGIKGFGLDVVEEILKD